LTAISRKDLPNPVKWLLANRLIHGIVLDYGCGRCKPFNDLLPVQYPEIKSINSYDPYYSPDDIILPHGGEGWYDVVLCTYVLCTLPEKDEKKILKSIKTLIRPNGVAYITVRNDEPKQGYGVSSKGTFQRRVELPYLYEFRKCHQYRIYLLTSDTYIRMFTL
jgi:hypothetical protein